MAAVQEQRRSFRPLAVKAGDTVVFGHMPVTP